MLIFFYTQFVRCPMEFAVSTCCPWTVQDMKYLKGSEQSNQPYQWVAGNDCEEKLVGTSDHVAESQKDED